MATTTQVPTATDTQRWSTGRPRLDTLTGGGLVAGSATLLSGPPFSGKRALVRRLVTNALAEGTPATVVSTDRGAREVLETLQPPKQHSDGWVEALAIVDAYSHHAGLPCEPPCAVPLDGPADLQTLVETLSEVQERQREEGACHLVVDSLSTLMAHNSSRSVIGLVQRVRALAQRSGGSALLLITPGAHSRREVEQVRRLCDGAIHLEVREETRMLSVHGPHTRHDRVWVEYEYGRDELAITGSLSAHRIR